MQKNIGFISTRFAGTDGVTLEASKWAQVLKGMGHACFWFAGRLDKDPARSQLVPEAFFHDPKNEWINARILGHKRRDPAVTDAIQASKLYLKQRLREFIERFGIDLIIPQNALTIPMHVPLGMAITEIIDPKSIIPLSLEDGGRPFFPAFGTSCEDSFLRQIDRSGKKWVILTDPDKTPLMVLDADGFLRHALFHGHVNPTTFCHRPIIVRDLQTPLGAVIAQLKVAPQTHGDDVIDQDIILVWGEERRIITGADILGRLMRGITESISLTETQKHEPQTGGKK